MLITIQNWLANGAKAEEIESQFSYIWKYEDILPGTDWLVQIYVGMV